MRNCSNKSLIDRWRPYALAFGVVSLVAYCGMLWWLDGKDRVSKSASESKDARLLVASCVSNVFKSMDLSLIDVWIERRSCESFRGVWLKRVAKEGYRIVVSSPTPLQASVYLVQSDDHRSLVRINPGFLYYLDVDRFPEDRFELGIEAYGKTPRFSRVIEFRAVRNDTVSSRPVSEHVVKGR